MANSPLTGDTDMVTFAIKVDGSRISDTYGILSIRVYKEINSIPYAAIEIVDGDAGKLNFLSATPMTLYRETILRSRLVITTGIKPFLREKLLRNL